MPKTSLKKLSSLKYSSLKISSLKFSSLVAALCVSLALTACGTNPVTKKKEIQLVS